MAGFRITRSAALFLVAALAATAARAASPAGVHEAGTWVAACNNMRACQAFALPPLDRKRVGMATYLVIDYQGQAGAVPLITLKSNGYGGVIWQLKIDGRPISGLGPQTPRAEGGPRLGGERGPRYVVLALSQRDAQLLLAALRTGSVLSIETTDDPHTPIPVIAITNPDPGTLAAMDALAALGSKLLGPAGPAPSRATSVPEPSDRYAPILIPLNGAREALEWIDARQSRTGSVAALWRPGPLPEAVPPLPPSPSIRLPPEPSQEDLPYAVPARIVSHLSPADCPRRDPRDGWTGDLIERVAPGLVLWGAGCTGPDGSWIRKLLLENEATGALNPVVLPAPPADDSTTFQPRVEGRSPGTVWLGAEGRSRDRRLIVSWPWGASCGRAVGWAWDGKAFVVVDERLILDCRGVLEDDRMQLFAADVR
jgi:hypothetical protein